MFDGKGPKGNNSDAGSIPATSTILARLDKIERQLRRIEQALTKQANKIMTQQGGCKRCAR